MSTAYLRNTILTLVGAVLMACIATAWLFRPLVSVVQSLTSTSSVKPAPAGGEWVATVAVAAGILLSLTAGGLAVAGIGRDRSRQWVWALLLAGALLVLAHAVGIAVMAPKFRVLYRDLGV